MSTTNSQPTSKRNLPRPISWGASLVVFCLTEWMLAHKRKIWEGALLALASAGFQLLVRPYHYAHPFTDFGVMGGLPNWLMGLGAARALLAFPYCAQRPKWAIGLVLAATVLRELTALHVTLVLDYSVFDPEDVVAYVLAAGLAYYFFAKPRA
jgi:hypothetical protein